MFSRRQQTQFHCGMCVGGGGVGVVGVDVGEQGAHDGGHARADVLAGEAREVGHGLVDGLDAVADGELVHDLLLRLVEVHLPRVLAVRLRKLHLVVVLKERRA